MLSRARLHVSTAATYHTACLMTSVFVKLMHVYTHVQDCSDPEGFINAIDKLVKEACDVRDCLMLAFLVVMPILCMPLRLEWGDLGVLNWLSLPMLAAVLALRQFAILTCYVLTDWDEAEQGPRGRAVAACVGPHVHIQVGQCQSGSTIVTTFALKITQAPKCSSVLTHSSLGSS
eukprot:TRINITY_DN12159_c0_g2_i2.p2 TRINITY_DN12159_c0_g2~~TRINITY_DN12159_c0_g2_i2.p2  ORF type:complete len:175 (-),score=3.08 TRINITY_DN12159_c0_g2_i2:1183-1707(-)